MRLVCNAVKKTEEIHDCGLCMKNAGYTLDCHHSDSCSITTTNQALIQIKPTNKTPYDVSDVSLTETQPPPPPLCDKSMDVHIFCDNSFSLYLAYSLSITIATIDSARRGL